MAQATLFDFLVIGNTEWAGCVATFYEADGATLKNIWTTPDYDTGGGTGYSPNPVTLSAKGSAVLYGSGRYTIAIATTGGVQKALLEKIDMYPSGRNEIVLSQYGQTDPLIPALAAIPSNEAATIIVSGRFSMTVNSSITIPSQVTLLFDPGSNASLNVGPDVVVTIEGPLINHRVPSTTASNYPFYLNHATSFVDITSKQIINLGDLSNVDPRVRFTALNFGTAGTIFYPGTSSMVSVVAQDSTGASGGNKGVGTINAQNGVFDNGVQLTDFVFEKYFLGEPLDTDRKNYQVKTLEDEISYVKNNLHLSTILGRKEFEEEGAPPLGRLISQIWESIETQFIYIYELEARIKELESND